LHQIIGLTLSFPVLADNKKGHRNVRGPYSRKSVPSNADEVSWRVRIKRYPSRKSGIHPKSWVPRSIG